MVSDRIPQNTSILPTRARRRSTLTVNSTAYPSYSVILVCLIFGLYKTSVNGVLTFGPIIISHFDHNDSHIGIYVMTAFWFGGAFAVIPASYLFAVLGRKKGFAIGLLGIGLGLIICIIGTIAEIYIIIIGGIAVFGAGNSILGFLRYAAAEVAGQDALAKATALTYVLAAGIISAALGPSISSICFKVVKHHQFVVAFSIMILLVMIAAGVLYRVSFPPIVSEHERQSEAMRLSMTQMASGQRQLPRSLRQITSTRSFKIAVMLGVVSTVGMDVFTSSMGIAMYAEYGISLSHVSAVFLVHFIGMTAPGLVTGILILRYGVFAGCAVGCLLNCSAVIIFFMERTFLGFIIGGALLGIGWSFTAASASMLVLAATTKSEAHRKPAVQSMADFWAFLCSGLITMVTSAIYQYFQWQGVCILGSVFIGLFLVGNMLLYALGLQGDMHFENLMSAKDEQRELEVEMGRIGSMHTGGNPMHTHDQRTPVSPQDRAKDKTLVGVYGNPGGYNSGGAEALATPGIGRSRNESMDSTESDEYSSVTPRAGSIRQEYERAGSGLFRSSLIQEALAMDLDDVETVSRHKKEWQEDEGKGEDDDDEKNQVEDQEGAKREGSTSTGADSTGSEAGDKKEVQRSERLSEIATAVL